MSRKRKAPSFVNLIYEKGNSMKLTQEYLKECLDYDPETGIFTWKERPVHHFKATKKRTSKHICNWWNNRFAGKKTGSLNTNKDVGIFLNHKQYKAHRLAFLYMEGYIPEYEVDHIDRNRSNNKWNNLRHVTGVCNCQNRKVKSTNKSGVTGVYKRPNNRWASGICINGKNINLGIHINFIDAVWARYNEEQNNPDWNCSTYSSAENYLKENNLL